MGPRPFDRGNFRGRLQYRFRVRPLQWGRDLSIAETSGRPVSLATWRLTSPYRDLLEAAAARWGGEVRRWEDAPGAGEQWDLVTEASELDVLVPPQDVSASQFHELWRAGGIARRCDGETELLSGGPCQCDPDHPDCDVSTHLFVLLPELPDLGVWRLRTTGWAAAQELPWATDLLLRLAGPGGLASGRLAIETRTRRHEGLTRHFAVPVLRAAGSLAEALGERTPPLGGGQVPELPTPVADPGATGSADAPGDAVPAGDPRPAGDLARVQAPAAAPVPGSGSSTPDELQPATEDQWERALRVYRSRPLVLHRVRELHPDDPPASAEAVTRGQMARLLLRGGGEAR